MNRRDLNNAGVWLAIVGTLYLASLIGRGAPLSPTTDPAAFARLISSPRGIVSAGMWVVAAAAHIVGVIVALRGVGLVHPRFATMSAVLTIFGLVVTTAVIGPFVYTWPAITRSYLDGNTRAMDIVTLAVGPLFISSVMVEGLLLTAGSILFARVLSRAGVASWITITYALSAPLYSTPILGYTAELMGSLFLLSAAIGLVRTPQGDAASAARA